MANPIVLLVDDNVARRAAGAQRLREASYYVETAGSASEALEKAKQIVPDAILSDVMLGDLDGFGLCRLLRTEPALADVPIVLLSDENADPPDHHLAHRVGASALIDRSPDFDAELSALRRCLLAGALPQPDANDVSLYTEHLRSNAKQIHRLRGRARIAEERYPALLRHAKDTITFLTTDGYILEANERWTEITGTDPKDMVGRHIRDLSPPGDADAHVAAYRENLAHGRGTPVPIRKPDGTTIYMEFTNSVTVYEGSTTVLAIGRDVTEQVAAAAALRAAEEKYRSLVEHIPDVVWTSTVDGTLTYITPNAQRVLGVAPEVLMRGTPADRAAAVHPDDRERVTTGFRNFARGGQPFDLEYRRQRPDGSWLWVRNRSTAAYERDGVRYIEGMLSDIDEQKRLEESLRQSQKMEALGQLTGGIAHDFNNLLEVILANSAFLQDALGADDPRRADAELISDAARRAAALTRQLLAFSRRQVLEPTTVDLNAALHGVESMLHRLIGADIAFSVERAPALGTVRVDRGQLEQVILNLVLNARDAMPAGGALTLATANVEVTAAAALPELPAGPYVKLAVHDTGSGIDAATLPHIFEPFFTTKEVGRGTGLGLSTCYGIVKQSSGHIAVQSTVGVGTTFELYLPRIDAATTRPRPRAASGTLTGTETILIVEDDPHVRTAVRRMLQPRGYQLLIADGAAAAETLIAAHPGQIDLVLSDVVMPDQCGPEVVQAVLAQSPGARTLYMSGYTDHPVLRSGSLGPDTAFLQKPFGPEALARKVREVLDS